MKRDLDLIRAILTDMRRLPAAEQFELPEYTGFDRVTVLEHARLLIKAGLVEGQMLDSLAGVNDAMLIRITWHGHDFIDDAEDDSVWARVKTRLAKISTGASWAVVMEVLKAEAKAHLGLP